MLVLLVGGWEEEAAASVESGRRGGDAEAAESKGSCMVGRLVPVWMGWVGGWVGGWRVNFGGG